MSQAQVLYDLQQIDTEIRTKKQRLGEVLRLQKEPPALLAAREKAAAAEADLGRWRARHKDLTLEIATVADKAKRSEERLYSGVVKNPKELNDLQHEVEALGRRRATLEDEALQVMMTVDERQAISGAAAMELQHQLGTIARGKKARFIITKPMSSLAYLPYAFGESVIERVVY